MYNHFIMCDLQVSVKKPFHILRKMVPFLPALLVMLMIFFFSSQPAYDSSELSWSLTEQVVSSVNDRFQLNWTYEEQEQQIIRIEHYIRKLAHFTEFALLAVTLAVPLYHHYVQGVRMFLLVWGFSVIYAFSDEFHQLFVAGRTGRIDDVMIDSAGALFGVLIVWPLLHLLRAKVFIPAHNAKGKNS